MQVLAGSLEVRLWREIGDVDNQCPPLQMTAGVSPPRAQIGGQMRTAGNRYDALPSLPLARVIENRDGSRRLHNLREKTSDTPEVGQNRAHATLAQRSVLRTVCAIDAATSHCAGR